VKIREINNNEAHLLTQIIEKTLKKRTYLYTALFFLTGISIYFFIILLSGKISESLIEIFYSFIASSAGILFYLLTTKKKYLSDLKSGKVNVVFGQIENKIQKTFESKHQKEIKYYFKVDNNKFEVNFGDFSMHSIDDPIIVVKGIHSGEVIFHTFDIDYYNQENLKIDNETVSSQSMDLWNPLLIGLFSIFLTPLFGITLLKSNWNRSGNIFLAKQGNTWLVVYLILLVITLFMKSTGLFLFFNIIFSVLWITNQIFPHYIYILGLKKTKISYKSFKTPLLIASIILSPFIILRIYSEISKIDKSEPKQQVKIEESTEKRLFRRCMNENIPNTCNDLGNYLLDETISNTDLNLKQSNESYKLSFQAFEHGCKLKNSSCCVKVAYFYLKGFGVIKDLKKAEDIFKTNCKKSNVVAQQAACLHLGKLYFKQKKYKESLKLMNNLCVDTDNIKSCSFLGDFHYKGLGVKRALSAAEVFYEIGCKHGDSSSCLKLGKLKIEEYLSAKYSLLYEHNKNGLEPYNRDVVNVLGKSCKINKHGDSCYYLAKFFDASGNPATHTTLQTYAKGCEYGNKLCCKKIRLKTKIPNSDLVVKYLFEGTIFDFECSKKGDFTCGEIGIALIVEESSSDNDRKKGISLLEEDCKFGSPISCFYLLHLREHLKNSDKIANLEQECKDKKHESCLKVAAYLFNKGSKDNIEKSEDMLDTLCKAKNMDGCVELANLYVLKPKSTFVEGGAELLTKYCKKGNDKACLYIGDYLVKNHFPLKNLKKAYKIWNKICKKGDAKACYRIGKLLEISLTNEIKVFKKIKKSEIIKYYESGCKNKDLKSCYSLGNFLVSNSSKEDMEQGKKLLLEACKSGSGMGCLKYGDSLKDEKEKEKYYKLSCDQKISEGCEKSGYFILAELLKKFI
jgi:uncharacterized protein